jgi:hypothetical protein
MGRFYLFFPGAQTVIFLVPSVVKRMKFKTRPCAGCDAILAEACKVCPFCPAKLSETTVSSPQSYWYKRPDGMRVQIIKANGPMRSCCKEMLGYFLERISLPEARLNTAVGWHCGCGRVVQPEDIAEAI